MEERYAYDYKDLIDFYPPNRIAYAAITKHINQLSPFVGAGLSAFAYPTWQNLFSSVVQMMPKNDLKTKVEDAIANDDFFTAGDIVFDCLQAPTFLSLIQDVFDSEKIQDYELENEAVYLIPEIFHGLCFTTNFDKVLEKAYTGCRKLYNVATPKDTKLIGDSIKDNKNVIFKIHGDIDSSPEQIVLTGASYKRHYSPNSALTKQLSFGMKARRMIFLGASLKKDRTLDMLKKSIVRSDVNYAIVGVESHEQIIERNKELAPLGISAIFYPINSAYKHKWVRIILEWIKDGFSPSSVDEVNKIIANDRYYKYAYERRITSYIYPQRVYNEFISFINADDSFLWWEITSQGGGGKSRFALEIEDVISRKNWKVKKYDISNFSTIFLDTNQMEKNTLYIFDDSDYYNSPFTENGSPSQRMDVLKFRKWLNILIQNYLHKKKLRIVFLFNSTSSTANNCSNLLWWRGLSETYTPMCLNQYCEDYLTLDMCTDDLINLMLNYAQKNYGQGIPLEFLNKMRLWFTNTDDSTLRIPLVAMLCVDAYFSQESLGNFIESVYQRITQIEHFRVIGSLRFNLEEYIKNIQAITETFYNHGHFNENTLHPDIDLTTDIQNAESFVNVVESSGVNRVEKS